MTFDTTGKEDKNKMEKNKKKKNWSKAVRAHLFYCHNLVESTAFE